jgi:hypothetical protein
MMKIVATIVINLATNKTAVKLELFFTKLASICRTKVLAQVML